MGFSTVRAAVLAMVVLAIGVLAGCGGSGSGTTDGSTETSGSSSGGSSAPTAGFSKKAKQASFGEEASEGEREQASALLERNMSARAAGTYKVQCETLSASAVKVIEEGGNGALGGKKGCAEILEAEAKNAPPGLLENTLLEPIRALRIKGTVGYALYYGRDGNDYAMKMEKENGEWLVAATLTETLPKG